MQHIKWKLLSLYSLQLLASKANLVKIQPQKDKTQLCFNLFVFYFLFFQSYFHTNPCGNFFNEFGKIKAMVSIWNQTPKKYDFPTVY